MINNSSATLVADSLLSRSPAGTLWGLLGVTAFSFTVPLTRFADAGLSPLFIGSARGAAAALLAVIALATSRQGLPRGVQWFRIALVGGGVVLGFPLLTSYALQSTPASHGAVVIALLPAATAVMAALRGRERPRPSFWVMAAVGAMVALLFAALQGGGFGHLELSDALLFAAVLAAAVGYAEGGLLARQLGSWQTICWALLVSSPVTIALTAFSAVVRPPSAGTAQWAAFAYLAGVSMFLGFFAWYHGLAIGPMATVSQVQLVQPVLSIVWAALLLDESVTWVTVAGGVAVIVCAGIAVRIRRTPKET